jgi:DNA-binding protein HU-beta
MAKKSMSKSKIVAHFAEKFDMPKKDAAEVVEEFTTLAIKQTKTVGEFTIPGIGKLVKQKRKARMGRNPQTGEAIRIPAKTVVKMRVSKSCKDSIIPPKK